MPLGVQILLRTVACGCALAATVGCSPPHLPPRNVQVPPLSPREQLPRPQVLWTANPGSKLLGVANGTILTITDGDCKEKPFVLHGLSGTGKTTFQTELRAGCTFSVEPTVLAGSSAFFLSTPEEVAIVHARTGQVVLHERLSDYKSWQESVLVADFAVQCADRKLIGWNLTNGKQLPWSMPCERIAGAGANLIVTSPPPNPTLPWEHPPGPVTAINAQTGAPIWQSPLRLSGVFSAQQLVVANLESQVIALNAASGSQVWKVDSPLGCPIAGAAESNGEIVLYGDGADGCHATAAVGAQTGATLWRLPAAPELTRFDKREPAMAGRQFAWREGFQPALLMVDIPTGAASAFALSDWVENPAAIDNDWVVSSPTGVARLSGKQSRPALAALPAKQALDEMLTDPLGLDPEAVEIWNRNRPLFEPFFPDLATRIAGLPEVWMLGVVDSIQTLHLPGLASALTRRFPTLVEKRLQTSVVDLLSDLNDPVALPAFEHALNNQRRVAVAAAALARLGDESALPKLDAYFQKQHAYTTSDDCANLNVCNGPDMDGDGWSDALEHILGTRADASDTDGDGLADAVDPCPTFTTPADGKLQAAFDALVSLHRPGWAAFLAQRSTCLLGSRGPLVPYREGEQVVGIPILALRVEDSSNSPEHASVRVSFGCGPLCGFVYRVEVTKQKGSWYFTRIEGLGGS
ncbi:MAG: PQQ-binding-like beta-propeller repeat protein [Polyangiaceae bacterium]|nr:PQQ-binding-like beta-propeller repeat protein [Polyangiaceae bacterium]